MAPDTPTALRSDENPAPSEAAEPTGSGGARGRRGGRTDRVRSAAVAALVLLPVAGAAVGAGTHTKPARDTFAEAGVAVDPAIARTTDASTRASTLRYLADVVKLPSVVAGARASLATAPSVAEIIRETKVTPIRRRDEIRIETRQLNAEGSTALANALGRETVNYARATVPDPGFGASVVGNFDGGNDGWTGNSSFSTPPLNSSPFSTRPLSATPVSARGRHSRGFLRIVCPATASCGPALNLHTGFSRGRSYRATAWARSDAGAQVSMVLGSSGRDVAVGRYRDLRSQWRPLSVTWIPRTGAPSAELTFQTTRARSQSYDVDDVWFREPAAELRRPQLAGVASRTGAARLIGSTTVLTGRPVGTTADGWTTAAWAGLGALVGLASAAAAVGLGLAARRRQTPE